MGTDGAAIYDDGMSLSIVAFATGILLVQLQGCLPSVWPLLAGAALALTLARQAPRGGPRLLAVLVASSLLGAGWATWRAELRLADALGSDWEGRDVMLLGTVAGLPQAFDLGIRFEFAVDTVLTAGAVVPQRISLAWYRGKTGVPDVLPDQRWQLVARLKRPHGSANPGGFDYEGWLFERGLRATGYVRPDPAVLVEPAVNSPRLQVERLRARVRAAFQRELPAERWPLTGILTALAVGDQQAVDNDLWRIFNRTGTTHLMAISGLHVTMVAGVFGWLAAFVWRRVPGLVLRLPAQQAGVVAAALAAFGYAALAGFGVPAQRTLYMLLTAAAVLITRRRVAPGRILALALLVVLLADPWAVRAPGFWLSFGVVGALLYIAPAGGQTPDWRARLHAWWAVQWAATLASLPILLLVFQQFSLVSPLANALAIPVISFIVTPLALLGAVLPWWPILALAHGVLEWLIAALGWLAGWPVWQTAQPPLAAVLLAGVGVGLGLLPRAVPGRMLGFFMLLPALFWAAPRPPSGQAWIDVLDVGQGQAVVVRTQQHALLADAGPRYSATSDAGERVVLPFLRAQGVDRLDLLLATHDDSDHVGGLASVRRGINVDQLRSSAALPDAQPCVAGQRWTWDGVDFSVLHPAAGAAGSDNDRSCVLRIDAGSHGMLLVGDLEAAGEAALLARGGEVLAADVLLVGHHGSRTSTSAAFLAAVDPAQALISVGYRNRFGHPHGEVLDRLQARGSTIWRTDRDGALQLRLGGEVLETAGWRGTAARYWHGR